MGFAHLCYLFLVALPHMLRAEFYSDVDSKDHDEAKALEIKARDFWNGLMEGADGLQSTDNARLCAEVDQALETLPPEDAEIRDLFHAAVGHLATADGMLFEEASSFKKLALQRLQHGPSKESFMDFASDWEDSFYNAITSFIGYRTYEKRLAKHISGRLKDVTPNLDRAAQMARPMLDESSKASDRARDVLQKLSDRDVPSKPRHLRKVVRDSNSQLRKLAHGIITATGRQRLRFTNYLLNSLMTTAVDMAGKEEAPSKTMMKASLQSMPVDASSQRPMIIQGEAKHLPQEYTLMRNEADQGKRAVQKNAVADSASGEPPLVFFDGVPVDETPPAGHSLYASNIEQLVDV